MIETLGDVIGDQTGIVTDAIDETRLARALEVEPEGVHPGGRRDASVVNDLATDIEHRHVQPWIAAAVPRRPKYGGDPGVPEVQLAGRILGDDTPPAIRGGRRHERLVDEGVDSLEKPVELALRGVHGATEVIAEPYLSALCGFEPPREANSFILQDAQVDGSVVGGAHELQRRLPARRLEVERTLRTLL